MTALTGIDDPFPNWPVSVVDSPGFNLTSKIDPFVLPWGPITNHTVSEGSLEDWAVLVAVGSSDCALADGPANAEANAMRMARASKLLSNRFISLDYLETCALGTQPPA